jgi:hypothetical protein
LEAYHRPKEGSPDLALLAFPLRLKDMDGTVLDLFRGLFDAFGKRGVRVDR